ncbi:Lysine ketoglutarate reductase trans-splicing protein [Heracleum sosnowskyi]|uniref:Lysine ketoglutarate reductase trans-splicing protein n=1 Tax=Heracleum sosnowskyi TaxID=360622 RepID=A0AAD8IDP0_9APIA|nr:Lysine ketoglutarate reductase trans-splicing protein [Heracleum sosnowskyi]
MPTTHRSVRVRRPVSMRLVITTFAGVVFGFFLGVSLPPSSFAKLNRTNLLPSFDISYFEEKYSGLSTQALLNIWATIISNPLGDESTQKIWVATNPRGAERLPAGIVRSESDLYIYNSSVLPSQDLAVKPKYLLTFTVGYQLRTHIDISVKKFSSEDFTVMLFHYDNRTSEWDQYEWSKRAIHITVPKQTKWWYAKRFLHPDIVAPYDYIFIWDEDLGIDKFDPQDYIRLVMKYGLEISQPGLSPDSVSTWRMTQKKDESEVHKLTEERPGWCPHPHLPPCAAFIEIMAPVFSRSAWRCVWHLIQNDLVHGWGLDFALGKCVEPAHEKIGVVDSQWVVHASIPTLGNQGIKEGGKTPWEGVRERCRVEWAMFQNRFIEAEKSYYESQGIDVSNYSSSLGGGHIHSRKFDVEGDLPEGNRQESNRQEGNGNQ